MLVTLYSVSLLLLFSTTSVFADANNISGASSGEFTKVGGAGAQFLKIGVGGRANALAGAYSAISNDLSAVYWNPASIADIHAYGAFFSYTNWFASFSHNYAAACLPVGERFMGAVQLTSFNSGDIELTTLENSNGTGSHYKVSDYCVGLSFAGNLTDQFAFGITAKYIVNTFSSVNASGIAFDIGTIYDTGLQGIKLGFTLKNLGTQETYSGVDLRSLKKYNDAMDAAPIDVEYLANPFSIPLIFTIGASSEVYKSGEHVVLAAIDFVTHSDVPENYCFGAEYTWNELISLRGGYIIGHDQFNASCGIGFRYFTSGFGGILDYSFSPSSTMGYINRLSLQMQFK